MATITKSTELPAAPERVWEALTRLDQIAQWNTVHTGYGDGAPEQLADGAAFKEKLTIMGMPGEVDWKVTEFTDGQHVKMEGVGPMGTTMAQTFDVAAASEGTQLELSNEFGGAAIAAMEGPLTSAGGKALDDAIAKLRELVG